MKYIKLLLISALLVYGTIHTHDNPAPRGTFELTAPAQRFTVSGILNAAVLPAVATGTGFLVAHHIKHPIAATYAPYVGLATASLIGWYHASTGDQNIGIATLSFNSYNNDNAKKERAINDLLKHNTILSYYNSTGPGIYATPVQQTALHEFFQQYSSIVATTPEAVREQNNAFFTRHPAFYNYCVDLIRNYMQSESDKIFQTANCMKYVGRASALIAVAGICALKVFQSLKSA